MFLTAAIQLLLLFVLELTQNLYCLFAEFSNFFFFHFLGVIKFWASTGADFDPIVLALNSASLLSDFSAKATGLPVRISLCALASVYISLCVRACVRVVWPR